MNSETRTLVVTVLKRSGVGDRVSATPEEYRERIAELVADALEASAVSSPPTITDDVRRAAERLLRDVNPKHRPAATSLLAADVRAVALAVLSAAPAPPTAALHPGGETNGN